MIAPYFYGGVGSMTYRDIKLEELEEKLSAEYIRYLKVAIALAIGSDDIHEMPQTKLALKELYHKLDRMYKTEASEQ
jgi:hypothetical protein